MKDNHLISKYIQPLFPLPTHLTRSGRINGRIRAVLFDIYGTLFISGAGDIGVSRKQGLRKEFLDHLPARHGISTSGGELVEALHREIAGRHDRERKKGIEFPEVDIVDVWMSVLGISEAERARAFAVEFEMIVNPVYPMPYLGATLEACKQRGLALGIVSNAQFYTPWLFHWFLGAGPEDLGFRSDLIWYSYEHGVAKPSGILFNMAKHRLAGIGIPPEAVLYVGNDMRNDILPAAETGFKTALFAGDARSLRLREDDVACRDLSPDLTITRLDQLTQWL